MKGPSNPQVPWVERIRVLAAALAEIISIIEHLLIRIFKALDRILFHIVMFAGIVWAVYEIFKHH